jgi:hypothetical protein
MAEYRMVLWGPRRELKGMICIAAENDSAAIAEAKSWSPELDRELRLGSRIVAELPAAAPPATPENRQSETAAPAQATAGPAPPDDGQNRRSGGRRRLAERGEG